MRNILKSIFILLVTTAIISSCSKSDDGDNPVLEESGSIEVVIKLLSPLDDWKFHCNAILSVSKDIDSSEITYENTQESRNLGINITQLELGESIHTFSTSDNAKELRVLLGGLRDNSTEPFNVEIEVYFNDKLQHTEDITFEPSSFAPTHYFSWSIDDGYVLL